MSLSQCFMSSIVTVSFPCKGRNDGAILSLALSNLVLAHGRSAALAAVGGGIYFRDVEGFFDAVYLISDSRIGRAYGPYVERCTTPLSFLVFADCPLEPGEDFSRSPALLVGSGSKWLSRTRHWAKASGTLACAGPTGPCELSSAALSSTPGSRIFLGSQV